MRNIDELTENELWRKYYNLKLQELDMKDEINKVKEQLKAKKSKSVEDDE